VKWNGNSQISAEQVGTALAFAPHAPQQRVRQLVLSRQSAGGVKCGTDQFESMKTLRNQVAQIVRHRKLETWTYVVLAIVSAGSVGYAIAETFRLFNKWPAFVQVFQDWFG
jgi:hypothetical protein